MKAFWPHDEDLNSFEGSASWFHVGKEGVLGISTPTTRLEQ